MSEQNGSKRNVVIVMYQYSVIVKTIERKLQELRYEVEILAGEFDKIAEKAIVFGVSAEKFCLRYPEYIVAEPYSGYH